MVQQGNRPPARLRELVSWQANRVAILGTRLTAQEMPLPARAEYAVLAAVAENGPVSQADLGRILGLDRNDISTVVGRLAKAGQVSKHADPGDTRRNLIGLTTAGENHLTDLQARADRVQAALLTGLTAAEQDQLVTLLEKVLAPHPALPA